jgi:hypothetical protein
MRAPRASPAPEGLSRRSPDERGDGPCCMVHSIASRELVGKLLARDSASEACRRGAPTSGEFGRPPKKPSGRLPTSSASSSSSRALCSRASARSLRARVHSGGREEPPDGPRRPLARAGERTTRQGGGHVPVRPLRRHLRLVESIFRDRPRSGRVRDGAALGRSCRCATALLPR